MPKRKRRTYSELFLSKLEEVSEPGNRRVSNKKLLGSLNWDEARYDMIKRQLLSEGKIGIGRGHGGSVELLEEPEENAPKAFISYCHKDEAAKDKLLNHLMPLKRVGLIQEWHDRRIEPGQEWEVEIQNELRSADIVLLLVSVDFINSDFCYDSEMRLAMERHENGTAIVIPIILRNCLWALAPFSKLQVLPKNARPISSWEAEDDAYVDVVVGIRRLLEKKN